MDAQTRSDKFGLSGIELAIIMVIILGILCFVSLAGSTILMMPKFTAMFNDLGVQLPLATRILISTTDAFQTYWAIALIIFIVCAVLLRQNFRRETNQAWLNRLRHKLSLKHLIISISLSVMLMAIIIGFIASAVLLPIFKANQLLTG